MKTFKLLRIFFIILLLPFTMHYSQVTPTNQWVNFYSDSTFVNGLWVEVGSVITAFDPDDVLCGIDTVTTEGLYGFMSVYGDDSSTPGLDEGAMPGDTIKFKIDDVDAVPIGPNIWTSNGDIFKVNLHVGGTPLPPVANAGVDQTVKENIVVQLDGSGSYDPNGNPIAYQWTSPPGITLSSNTLQSPIFLSPSVSNNTAYTFVLKVNDTIFDSEPDTVVVNVDNCECINGSIIYNTNTGKFNFCEDCKWVEK